MTDQELVKLLEKWKNEIKKLAVGYERGIGNLDKAVVDYNKRKDNLVLRFGPHVLAIVVVLLIFYLITRLPCGTEISYAGVSVTTHCK